MTAPASILDTALAFHAAGIATIPVKSDGSKAPAIAWRDYQTTPPTVDDVIAWFGNPAVTGIGILTGAASGQLEMLELEGRAIKQRDAIARLRDYADDNDLRTLLDRVIDGYAETTPSGGLHLLLRVSDAPARRNTKLARTADRQVLAETRGEGGFVVVAPSTGPTHATGKPWRLVSGGPSSIATITGEQRDMLYALFGMLDEEPPRDTREPAVTLPGGATPGSRPGDDYNARATWDDILLPHGWTKAWKMGRGHAWVRPGKDRADGISATTGQAADGIDRLYVFSTSTVFDAEVPYTKFGAYALLEHAGDHAVAAKALAAAGYGTPARQAVDAPAPASAEPPTGVAPPPAHSNEAAPTVGAATAVDVAMDEPPAALPEPVPAGGDLAHAPASTLAMSEDGHSQALIAEYGTSIRHCSERGRWLHWDGWRWAFQPASGGMVREYAKAVARAYPDDGGWKVHKKRSLSAAGTTAALTQAATDFRVAVSQTELDARPWELNTPGGIVDLRTGALTASDPAKLHTKLTAATPDPDADPSAWLAFLDTTFQGDAELIAWMQRLLGYACIGVVRENILPVFYGATGANGKTVLLDTVMALLGDYAGPAPKGFLLQGPSKHDTEIADLAGIRMLVSSETNSGERFDEGKVKLLTGGDMLKARFMRQDFFRFTPSHTIFLMSNHRPEVTSGGDAFWRRVREVPFDHQVPEHLRDPELKDRLVGEHGSAIMAWLAAGAAKYAASGLAEPARVRAATTEYARDTDTVARFVDEMCMLGGTVPLNTARARSAYERFCDDEGATPVSAKAFGQALRARYGVTSTRSNGQRFYVGLTVLDGDVTGEQERAW